MKIMEVRTNSMWQWRANYSPEAKCDTICLSIQPTELQEIILAVSK